MKTKLRNLTAIGSVVLLAGCSPISTKHSVLEYQVRRVDYDLKTNPQTALQDYLNAMSKDGWQLVQFVEAVVGVKPYTVLIRA